MAERFEKIGSIIFGVQRLNGAVVSLTNWFRKEISKTEKNIEENLQSQEIAEMYFAINNNLPKSKKDFFSIFDLLKLLDNDNPNLGSKNEDQIDSSLKQVKELHFLLADVIQDIGFPEIPPELLRQQGHRLST
ncbi:hypothetical protein [Massilia sp. CCM 8734]|uniref:hypothetical protein n=1 Tax=Massilia sp. CCM 8734 TaxID=2609283 RepID=UPI0014204086|nr:hypothetical protein [Massilia sp. CCM 8734]NIA00866.1 hypothetical protein [Massilia sp. CCM 8734]